MTDAKLCMHKSSHQGTTVCLTLQYLLTPSQCRLFHWDANLDYSPNAERGKPCFQWHPIPAGVCPTFQNESDFPLGIQETPSSSTMPRLLQARRELHWLIKNIWGGEKPCTVSPFYHSGSLVPAPLPDRERTRAYLQPSLDYSWPLFL